MTRLRETFHSFLLKFTFPILPVQKKKNNNNKFTQLPDSFYSPSIHKKHNNIISQHSPQHKRTINWQITLEQPRRLHTNYTQPVLPNDFQHVLSCFVSSNPRSYKPCFVCVLVLISRSALFCTGPNSLCCFVVVCLFPCEHVCILTACRSSPV